MAVGRSSIVGIAVVVAVLGRAATVGVAGQATGDQSPSFEVASVKHNKSDSPGVRLFFQPGGRLVAENVTLQFLIAAAYGDPRPLADFQIVGGPKWINTDRFNVIAKAEGDPQPGADGPPPIMFAMLRTLLAERFKVRVHDETREMPIYTLVKARNDGKTGEHLKRSTTDCAALMKSAGRDRPPTPPSPTERPPCGMRMGFGNLSVGGMTVLQFAGAISRMPGINRVVVDRTGLDGAYDIDLQWTPDQLPPRAAGAAADGPIRVNGVDIDPNGPSIFTAIQEQLGLKLESTKGPVHVIVIDAVDQPTDD
jgi:bla regulator protein blaR1